MQNIMRICFKEVVGYLVIFGFTNGHENTFIDMNTKYENTLTQAKESLFLLI